MNEIEKKVVQTINWNKDKVVKFLVDLIRIPSVSGTEGKAQYFLEEKFKTLGLKTDHIVCKPEKISDHPEFAWFQMPGSQHYNFRPNIVGRLTGSGGGRSLILFAHVDTIPVSYPEQWRYPAFYGMVDDGLIYGRGAADDKTGLAMLVMAAEAIIEAGVKLKGDMILLSTIEEEIGSSGGALTCVLEGLRADAAIYCHPTFEGLKQIGAANVGAIAFTVVVPGFCTAPSFYLSNRKEGNAIEKAIPIMVALKKLDGERRAKVKSPYYEGYYKNSTNLSLCSIKGGDYYYQIPPVCEVSCVLQYAPGEDENAIKRQIIDAVDRTCKEDEWLKNHPAVVFWNEITFSASMVDPQHDLVKTTKGALEEIVGQGQTFIGGIPAGSDIRCFNNYAKVPAISFGPNSKNIHGINECVSIDELMDSVKATAIAALRWCGHQG